MALVAVRPICVDIPRIFVEMGASIIVSLKTSRPGLFTLISDLQAMQRLSVDLMPLPVSKSALSMSAARSSVTADLLKNSVSGKTRMIQCIQHVTPNSVAVAMFIGPAVEVVAA